MTRNGPTPQRLRVLDLKRLPAADDDVVTLHGNDLRNAIATILASAELIESGELTDDQRHLYSSNLLREGRRLSAVVRSALALQKLETGHRNLDRAPVDLGSLIRRSALGAGVDDQRPIELHIPAQLPLVSAEPEAILDVLANFLSNARRFSPEGGAISVAAHTVGDFVEVSVQDHGIGLEAEALPRLFTKFYRADRGIGRLPPGAGLGLAMSHRIIEAHGGQVDASSNGEGKGARFQFTLPTLRPNAISGEVLIVDDDNWFATVLKAEFTANGVSSLRASDAETAERLLREMTPRAIILDLVLPGLQGEDFLAHMWSRGGKTVPVVVLTVKDLGSAEMAALTAEGAIAVLPKEAGAPQAAVALVLEFLARETVAG
jgi:CheY-like chemotaxis protein